MGFIDLEKRMRTDREIKINNWTSNHDMLTLSVINEWWVSQADPDVGAVYVPLLTILYVWWAILATQKKKHMLLEKLVALNIVDSKLKLNSWDSQTVRWVK